MKFEEFIVDLLEAVNNNVAVGPGAAYSFQNSKLTFNSGWPNETGAFSCEFDIRSVEFGQHFHVNGQESSCLISIDGVVMIPNIQLVLDRIDKQTTGRDQYLED